MSEVSIDRISIEIASTAQDAVAPIESLASAIKNLKNQTSNTAGLRSFSSTLASISNAGSGIKNTSSHLQGMSDKLTMMGKTSQRYSRSLSNMLGIGISALLLRRSANMIGDFVDKSIRYVENMNLFAVSMGNAADESREFVDNFSRVLGLDPSNVMRYMGFFNQLAEGLGVANEQSALISKNLTQLGYDMSSFLNIPVEEAMNKLESGLSGISKPLRTVGIATSEAALQAKLLSLGYSESYRNLSEASKVQLRYIQILDSTIKMQGDLARTIVTPANALRMLKENFEITSRSIGNMFIPALNAIVPYAIAALQIIAELANALAELFGFTLPVIDYSNISEGVDEIGASAGSAAKKMQSLVAPFDEIHDVAQQMREDAAGGAGGVDIDFDLSGYDALTGAISDRIDMIKDKFYELVAAFKADPVKFLSDALWDLGRALIGLIIPTDLPNFITALSLALLTYALTGSLPLAIAIGFLSSVLLPLLGQNQQMDLLSAAIGTLAGALLLYALGIPLPIATAISALVTSGLVSLFGTDAAISMLGMAITGLAVGLLTYSLTGDPLLAIALGLITGALIPLIERVADINLVGPALIGVAAGLATFIKTGSPIASLVVGIAGLVSSLIMLNDLSPELIVALGALGVAAGVFGIAIGVATGGLSLIIAGIVAVGASVAGLVVGLSQEAIPAIERFDETISASTQDALNPFMDAFDEIGKKLMTVKDTGLPITEEFASGLIGEFRTMADEVISATDRMKTEALKNLRALYGDEATAYEEAYEDIKRSYDARYAEFDRLDDALKESIRTAKLMYGEESDEYANAVAKIKEENDKKLESIGYTRKELDAAFAAEVEGIASLAPKYAEMREKTINELDEQKAGIDAKMEEINTILREKAESGQEITSEEWGKINLIRQSIFDEGLTALTGNVEEELRVREKMAENAEDLAFRQATQIAKESEKERDETIKNANASFVEKQKTIEEQRDKFGTISAEQADKMIAEAKRERDETVEAAEDRDKRLMDAARTYMVGFEKYWDELNRTQKDNGQIFSDNMAETFSNTLTAGTNFVNDLGAQIDSIGTFLTGAVDFISGVFSGDWGMAWDGLKNMGIGALNSILSAINVGLEGLNIFLGWISDGINLAISGLNKIPGVNIAPIEFRIPTIPLIPKAEDGGIIPRSADLFLANENGVPEMIGRYGNQTAVANQAQIVEGISRGVSDGMEGANAPVVGALMQAVNLLQGILDKPVISDTDIADANISGSARRGVRMSGNAAFTY